MASVAFPNQGSLRSLIDVDFAVSHALHIDESLIAGFTLGLN